MGEPPPEEVARVDAVLQHVADGDAVGRIESELPCDRCGYNLRSMRLDADCPECGFPVQQSTAAIVTKRWPYTAEEPCRGMAFGLITMLAVGVGIVPWIISLGFLVWRMPGGLFWSLVKHTTWLSLLCVVSTIALTLFDRPTVQNVVGEEAVIRVFTVALFCHYLCIFLIAIGITYQAGMRMALGIAIACLCSQFVAVLFSAATPHSMYAMAGTLVFAGICWMLFGTFYWSYVTNRLAAQRHALLQKSAGIDTPPIPSEML